MSSFSRGFLSAALLAVLLLLSPAAAQDQKPKPAPEGDVAQAIIEAPEEPVAPGRLVVIDATQSIGSIFLWTANEPFPAPTENWAIDSGTKRIHFATPLLPGKYAWTLTVIMPEATDDMGKGDQTQVVILVGDAPPPPPPAKLTIKLAKLIISEADDGGATSGTITREAVATEDLPIAVTSSDPDVVTVTPLVTIPAGETSVGFLVNAIDNDEENEDRVVTITAEAQGYEPVVISLTVTDDDEEEPPPPPVTDLWGIVVYESGQRDEYGPKMAQVILGTRLDALDENFTWLPFDQDEVDEDGNMPEEFEPWVKMLTAGGFEMPHLFLVKEEDEQGKLVDHMKLPDSIDKVIVEVRKYLPE